jgi:predicted DNA-binding antitoxin AbrB/MazE fold protein
MDLVEAIYHDGVFEPVERIDLPENQRIRLSVQAVDVDDGHSWLKRTKELRERIEQQQGLLPDSTPDIAADRLRDD